MLFRRGEISLVEILSPFGEDAIPDNLPHFSKQMQVKIETVVRCEPGAQHLACVEQMPEVAARIGAACPAAAKT